MGRTSLRGGPPGAFRCLDRDPRLVCEPLVSYEHPACGWEEAVLAEETAPITWRKSSYSGAGTNEDCCEVGFLPSEVRIRDSKLPGRAVLCFPLPAWRVALAYFGRGETAGGDHEPL
ncbi:DUF397 domain-containing protein [Streptomyces sp. NPDC050988]|uniref:DUF397 domain-containing protein n=1 Tax=Streptomyces sp. NPDC050988 TaxID=3365637 RepID=UPI00378FE37D